MKASISRGSIKGSVPAPPSKSYTIRGLMCGALGRGKSQIMYPLGSDDTDAASNVLRKIGTRVRHNKTSWTIEGGDFHTPDSDLYCGDSAATLRFMTALCSVIPGTCRLTAGASLSRRPEEPLLNALRQLGVKCSAPNDLPPVTVQGGKLKGGITSLPGDISSQYVSALLLVAPFAEKDIIIRVTTPLESKPYVLMTMDAMQWFGITVAFNDTMDEFQVFPQKYQPTKFRIEGDWSSASYPLALGALAGEVEVANLPTESMQGDRMLLDFLQGMGAGVTIGRNSVIVTQSKLNAVKADLTDCIDLLPTVAVLAAVAEGKSVLTGIARARLKESNRVAAVGEGLTRMGIKVTEEKDYLTITGGKPHGATIDSKNDHRIAMAFSLLGTVTGKVTIEGAECVGKTYPEWWDVMKSLGGRIKLDGE
ncbi:MAG: 3-phosphoshikimate 1-carboxyvinyltransferase [Dehalococcoidia bacterium]|nr:3-phosphoshikimate 1-carboxyvinyltransferase [Dehalococcoidia bacterium]